MGNSGLRRYDSEEDHDFMINFRVVSVERLEAAIMLKPPIHLGTFSSGHDWYAITKIVQNSVVKSNYDRLFQCSRCLIREWRPVDIETGIILDGGVSGTCDEIILRKVMES
jgi:hypothetical protein